MTYQETQGDGHFIFIFAFVALSIGVVLKHLFTRFKIPLPYTVALLIIGTLLGLAQLHHPLDPTTAEESNWTVFAIAESIIATIDPHLIMYVFLPTLLFESAINVHYRVFMRMLKPILLLAVPGLVVTSLLTAVLIYYGFSAYACQYNY